jgi:hypothetical protein
MAGWPFFVYPDFVVFQIRPPDSRLHPQGTGAGYDERFDKKDLRFLKG